RSASFTSSSLKGLMTAVTNLTISTPSSPLLCSDPNQPGGPAPGGPSHPLEQVSRRHHHRVPQGRERRCVAEVEVDELAHVHAGGDDGGEHVDALGRPLLAHDLAAEDPA